MEHFNQQWQSIQMEQLKYNRYNQTGKAMGHNVDGKTRQIVKLTMTLDGKACENQLWFRWAFNISSGTHIHRASKTNKIIKDSLQLLFPRKKKTTKNILTKNPCSGNLIIIYLPKQLVSNIFEWVLFKDVIKKVLFMKGNNKSSYS